MSAPARTRRSPGTKSRAASTPPTCTDQSTEDHRQSFDYDQRVVDQVDSSIWRAVYNGQFRLAVRCDICGRWLTDGRSKRAHRGPRCAAKMAI